MVENHADDGPEAERPGGGSRLTVGSRSRERKQRQGGRTCQPVHDADDQRPYHLVVREVPELSIQPSLQCLFLVVAVTANHVRAGGCARSLRVGGVQVDTGGRRDGESGRGRLNTDEDGPQVRQAEQDEQDGHRKFQAPASARWNDDAEQDDDEAHDQDGDRCPSAHNTPRRMALHTVRSLVTRVATAITRSGSVACRIPRKNPRVRIDNRVSTSGPEPDRRRAAPASR